MNIIRGFSQFRPLILIAALSLLLAESLYALGAMDQETTKDQAQAQAEAKVQAEAQAQVEVAIQKIRTACHVSDTETNPKKVNKQADCVARAVAAQKRKINTERALRSTLTQALGAPSISALERIPGPPPPPTPTPAGQPSYVGASASGTPSTCGPGAGANNPL